MSESTQSKSYGKWIGAIVPILIIILSLIFVDSTAPQMMLIVLASLILLYIVFGKRLSNAYKILALMLVNTMMCLILIEAVALIAQYFVNNASDEVVAPYYNSNSRRASLDYYSDTDWGSTYWAEMNDISTGYFPYVLWRHGRYSGEAINVDENYRRVVPNTDCDAEDAYVVYTFGGSAMWGTGAPDWGTIPAYLQPLLEADLDQAICIINHGQSAYVSTQELFALILELQSGLVPDLVIFYNGINDVTFASLANQPALHSRLDVIEARLQQQLPQFRLNTVQLLTSLSILDSPEAPPANDFNIGYNGETLAEEIIFTYLSNYETVQQLAELHGFELAFFMQPMSFIGNKPLTEEEEIMASEVVDFPQLRELAIEFYEYGQGFAEDNQNFFYLGNLFDEEDRLLFTDFTHTTPRANEIIATAIAEQLNLGSNNNE